MQQIYYNNLLAFNELYEKYKNANLPIKISYKLSKINQFVSQEIPFFQEKSRTIFENYGEFDENGKLIFDEQSQSVKIKQAEIDNFVSEYNDLLNLPIDFNTSLKLTLNDLETFEITPLMMEQLLPFIEE